MAKTIHRLTDIQIRNWIAKGEQIAKSDGDGLTFTLSSAGTATWVLRYRMGKRVIAGRSGSAVKLDRRRELTIGNYPDISLQAAREKSRLYRASIDEGRDPAIEKQEHKARERTAWTVRDLIQDAREKVLVEPEYSSGTIKYRNYDFDQVILPKLGARQVKGVTAIDIVDMIVSAKRTWTISKRILTATSKAFDHACGLKIIAANPCTGIKLTSLMGPRPPARKRVMLLEDELRLLLPDIDTIGKENGLAFCILLATCVRGIELVKARKEHVFLDRGLWWVPDEAVKTSRGFLVPLVPTVVEWFSALIDMSGDSAYVLPARQRRRHAKHGGDAHVGAHNPVGGTRTLV